MSFESKETKKQRKIIEKENKNKQSKENKEMNKHLKTVLTVVATVLTIAAFYYVYTLGQKDGVQTERARFESVKAEVKSLSASVTPAPSKE